MSSSTLPALSALRKDIQRLVKQGSNSPAGPGPGPNAEDPTLQGQVSIATDPDASPSKMGLPADAHKTKLADPASMTPAPGKDSTQAPGIPAPTQPPVDPSVTSPTSPVIDGATVKSAKQALADAATSVRNLLREGASAPAVTAAPPTTTKQAAPTVVLDPVDPDLYRKIAHDLLSCDEGAQLVNQFYTERLSQEAASLIVKQALDLRNSFVQTHAAPAQSIQNQAMNPFAKLANPNPAAPSQQQVEQFLASLPPHVKEAKARVDQANAVNLSRLNTAEQVEQYNNGFLDAVSIMKQAAEGEPDPAIPGGGEAEPSPEEIIEALLAMGVTPEELQSLLMQVAQQAGAGGGAPAGPAPEGAMPPSMG